MIIILKTLAEAEAIPDPKHIWVDSERIVVYTGEDIPGEPPAVSPD